MTLKMITVCRSHGSSISGILSLRVFVPDYVISVVNAASTKKHMVSKLALNIIIVCVKIKRKVLQE